MTEPKEISPSVFASIRDDANRHLKTWSRGAGPLAYARLIFFCPGFQLALSIRVQTLCSRIPVVGTLARRALWYATTIWFNCDIDPSARFGAGIYFPHPVGIVIGGEWDIGSHVSILQGVTLGRNSDKPTRRARIGPGSQLSAGAKVVGSVEIGAGATVGANAVVLQDVPAGYTAVGVPARMLAH